MPEPSPHHRHDSPSTTAVKRAIWSTIVTTLPVDILSNASTLAQTGHPLLANLHRIRPSTRSLSLTARAGMAYSGLLINAPLLQSWIHHRLNPQTAADSPEKQLLTVSGIAIGTTALTASHSVKRTASYLGYSLQAHWHQIPRLMQPHFGSEFSRNLSTVCASVILTPYLEQHFLRWLSHEDSMTAQRGPLLTAKAGAILTAGLFSGGVNNAISVVQKTLINEALKSAPKVFTVPPRGLPRPVIQAHYYSPQSFFSGVHQLYELAEHNPWRLLRLSQRGAGVARIGNILLIACTQLADSSYPAIEHWLSASCLYVLAFCTSRQATATPTKPSTCRHQEPKRSSCTP